MILSFQFHRFFWNSLQYLDQYKTYLIIFIFMKKKTDFIEEMKNSQQFLNKLQGFKKASKEIKDKNKLISHRNIWVKQYKYLTRLQRDQQLENANYFEIFDKYFGFEMEDRQIFGKDQYKSFTEYLKKNEEQNDLYEIKLWQELKSLPLMIKKIKQPQLQAKSKIDIKDAAGIMKDIQAMLLKEQTEISQQYDKILKSQLTMSKVVSYDGMQVEDGQGQYAFLHEILAEHNFDDVRGFDFQINQIRRIQEGQQHLKEYIRSLSDRLTQDEISAVIQEYQHASELLNQTLELQVQKIALDYDQALSLDNNLISMSENFQLINHIYNTYLGRGKSNALYNERLSIQFPNINKKILQRMTEYIQGKIYKTRKTNAVKRNYLREKQDLLQKVQKQVNDRIETKIKKAQKQAQKLQRKQQKLKLQKQLQQLRAQYQIRKAEKQKVIREEQQKQKQQERKKQAIRKLYLDQLSKKAAQAQQMKEKKQKQEQEKKKKQKEEQQMKKKKEIQMNKPKVQQRQTLEEKKIEKKLQQQKQKKELNIRNEERINKAIEKYSFRPEVQASQERLNAPTQGLLKKKQTLYDKADKIQLTKMTGYNINQLMGDHRFKLNTALFEAGLSNTDYARQVLNKMSKRPQNAF